MDRVFRNETGAAMRLYLHQDDPNASVAAQGIIRQITVSPGG